MERKKRPISITLIGCLFIAAGALGIAYHLPELKLIGTSRADIRWLFVLRVLALLGGIFLLSGQNWSRWLLVLWLIYHVGLSALHSAFEVGVHAVLLVIIVYFLFRAEASAYFRKRG